MAAALPQLTLHEGIKPDENAVVDVVKKWLAALDQELHKPSAVDLSSLFIDDCWWRDIVALSWDWSTKHGQESISKYLSSSEHKFSRLEAITTGALQPSFVEMGPGLQFVQSGFTFETRFGRGRGLVRLGNTGRPEWRAWTVFTWLEELTEKERLRNGKANGHELNDQPNTEHEDLQVLIVGAGQSGLAVAAHLQTTSLSYLVVDSNDRVGDSWRLRYDRIISHTPKYTDHYPFFKFPETWPTWLGQDKIAGWQEHYSQIMELKIRMSTTVQNVTYDKGTRKYTVLLQTLQGEQIVRPRHVVLATGMFSPVPLRPEFRSEHSFRGEVYHSCKHKSARLIPNVEEKRIVIIGCGTSAHDIAQDFVVHGAKSVSMVQRHPIFSLTPDSYVKTTVGLWDTPGITTDEADVIGNSFPFAVVRTLGAMQSQMMSQLDKELLTGMEKAGLALRRGEDGVGLVDHQFLKGGHFYIDQGACQMIVDGRIKILRHEGGVKDFYSDGVVMADGKEIEADVVVLATGFHRNVLTLEKIMGQEVKDKVGDLGFLDDEQQYTGWWRPTGFPGLWYMTGSFLWTRQYSKTLVLQIQAIEKGLNAAHYTTPDTRSRKSPYKPNA